MKNIINRSLVLTLLFGVLSCTDLKEEPVGLLAPEAFFKSVADVESAVLGSYADIASERFYGRKFALSLLLRGDMADIGDRNTPGRRQQVNDFDMDSNNGMITSFWPQAYKIIGATNAAIAGAEIVGEPVDKLNELVGEARFIRAFMYFHLVRVMGEIPYIDFFISDPAAVKEISKTSEADVYMNIIADMEFAKLHLPDSDGGLRSRPTKGTAAAYLALVHLTLGHDQDAYDEANWVIDNKATFGYDLMPDFAELYDGFNNDGLAEHVFMLDFLGQVNGSNSQQDDLMGSVTGIRNFSNDYTSAGWSVAVPSLDVFETWNENDYRREVSFIDSGYIDGVWVGYDQFAPNHGSHRPHIAKYYERPGNSGSAARNTDNNYPLMRYAEVLLIAAEAADNLGGKDAEVMGHLNKLRSRARNWAGTMTAFPPDVTGGNLTDTIREERRVELAFEYKRWYDIKRWGIGDEVFKGPNSLEPHANFDSNRDYYFPLPQDELDRNENLKPQNSGY